MNVAAFILDIIVVSIVSFLFLSRYINIRRNRIVVLIVTYIAWCFSFLILFILPLDVSNTYYRQCLYEAENKTGNNSGNKTSLDVILTTIKPVLGNDTDRNATTTTTVPTSPTIPTANKDCYEPLIGAPEDVLYILWQVVYWSSQVLTWLLLPFMQSYANAGDFTIFGRVKTSIVSNALYYGSYLLLAGIFLIVLVAKGISIDGPSLYSICVAASNTWGLFCLVFLLGYGLVEVPRICWRRGNVRDLLREAYFKVAKLSLEKSDAEDDLSEIAEVIKRTSQTVNSSHSELSPCITTMLDKLPEAITSRLNRRGVTSHSRDDTTSDIDLLGDISMKSLAKLHKKLISTLQRYAMAQARWTASIQRTMRYEDTVNSIANTGFYHHTTESYKGFFGIICTPAVEWYWRCLIQPWGFRLLACILAVFSLFVVWSEVVFWCPQPVLSLYAIFMDEAKKYHAFLVLELLTAFTVAYLSISAYYTIFKVRILSYYHLSPHHNTDENSLIFSGMLLCRFTPALCLNYLSLIHLEQSVNPLMKDGYPETAYSQVMGRMHLIPFISSGFNIYFPMAILVLCCATIFSLGTRILHALGFQQFIGEDDMTNELVEEGRQLISRERGYMDRAARRTERRKELENLGVYPRDGGESGQSTSTAGDLTARQRRNYMQPGADNFSTSLPNADPFLSSFPSTGSSVPSGGGVINNNDRSQLLSGPTDPPVYTQGRPLGNTGQNIPSSRHLFDDI